MNLLSNLFITRTVGKPLMPAYHAMKHRSSVMFMFFILLLVIGTSCGYFLVQQVHKGRHNGKWVSADKHAAHGDGHWDPFLGALHPKIFWPRGGSLDLFKDVFNLDVLGNYDPDSLEGLSKEIYFSLRNSTALEGGNFTLEDWLAGKVMATLKDPAVENRTDIHYGMIVFGMFCTVGINVLVLNMYVGVLSSLYSNAYERKLEHVSIFRGAFAWKALLLRTFLRPYFRPCCSRILRQPKEKGESAILSYNHFAFNKERCGWAVAHKAIEDLLADEDRYVGRG